MPTPHHFHGQLIAASAEPLHGIEHISVTLLDDEGQRHTAYMAFGRGKLAAQRRAELFAQLQIGQHYHGSATLRRCGVLVDPERTELMHFGNVVLAADRRRARFAPAQCWRAAA